MNSNKGLRHDVMDVDPEQYEREYDYWPWGELLIKATEWAVKYVPSSGRVVDYMCGTGYLINKIQAERSDLELDGYDINAEFIKYGKSKYSSVNLHNEDATKVYQPNKAQAIFCMAGLHHIEQNKHAEFMAKIASELTTGGQLIIGEELIADFDNEKGRRIAVLNLLVELLKHLVNSDTPDQVIQPALAVLKNDLLEQGEYKLSFQQLEKLLVPYFKIIEVQSVWSAGLGNVGDILIMCEKK